MRGTVIGRGIELLLFAQANHDDARRGDVIEAQQQRNVAKLRAGITTFDQALQDTT